MADGEVVPFPARPGAEPEPASNDTSYEVPLDDEPDGQLAPVHDGEAVARLPFDGERRAIIPAPLRSAEAFRAETARVAEVAWHHGAFHGLRSWFYLLKTLGWALVGLWNLLGWLFGWLFVTEHGPLKSLAVIKGDSREYRSLGSDARKEREERRSISLVILVVVAVVVGLFLRYAPDKLPIAITAGVVAVLLLARAGRPEDRPIITPSMITPRFRVISADVVLRAYYAAGLGDPVKEGQQVTFGSPMSRDGEGSRVAIDLPYGKGLKDAVDNKPSIASGLDVSLSQVFLQRDPTSYRRHVLWVADRDPLAVPVGRTPLLACKQTDIWKPAPLGLDERGGTVSVPMMWNSMLVGALPRQGKTFSARLLGLYAALDPYVKLSVFDGKGSPDWRKFDLVADSCAFGITPNKNGLPPEILRDTLLEMKADVQDRYERLSELEAERPDLCPEGKLTRALARDPRFRMPVRLLIIDEVQEYFDLGDISKEIAALMVFHAKASPGAGISVLVSTQKPSGIGGTGAVAQQFTSFRDQLGIRLSLRTSSWQVSEMVLGQGAYSEGLDSSTLLPQYKGVGILRGATDASPTVRTYLADGQDADKILTAARAIRQQAGTLSGMALGQEPEQDDRNVLADVLQVFGDDAGLQWPTLAARLEAQIPDRWNEASPGSISDQCRALGVPSVDVKAFGRAKKGCRRADVLKAAGQ
jgi:hypothetical protein